MLALALKFSRYNVKKERLLKSYEHRFTREELYVLAPALRLISRKTRKLVYHGGWRLDASHTRPRRRRANTTYSRHITVNTVAIHLATLFHHNNNNKIILKSVISTN